MRWPPYLQQHSHKRCCIKFDTHLDIWTLAEVGSSSALPDVS